MTGTVKEDTTARSRRKGTFVGLCITLLLVALMLAITGMATKATGLYVAAAIAAAGALALYLLGRRAATHHAPKEEEKEL
jgi:uncharacterized membrane protein